MPLLGLLVEELAISCAFMVMTCALCVPIEQWWPGVAVGRRRERISDILHTLINPALVSFVTFFVVALVELELHGRVRELVSGIDRDAVGWLREARLRVRQQPDIVQFMEATLLSALAGYWVHRALHGIPFLWRIHAVHHSSHDVDWLSSHRQHPLELVLLVLSTVLPPLLIGFSFEAVLGFTIFRKAHLVFSHSNFRYTFGPLRRVLVMPRHHHWHHERNSRCNFAGLFPFIDMAFGTYNDAPEFPQDVGTDTHVHAGYVWHLLHPVLRKVRKRCACR